jgi:predicted TIM-barrel fold metal-dependent hydrolase
MKGLLLLLLFSCSTGNISKNYGTDFHMHVHSPVGEEDVRFTGDRALLAVDSIGFHRALILSNSYANDVTEASAIKENDFVISEAGKFETRLAPACAVNPSKTWALEEAQRCHQKGVKVLKLHLMASGLDLKRNEDYQKVMAFLHALRKYNFTILIHANYPKATRGNEIKRVIQLINAFPERRWIIGHAFGREFEDLTLISHNNFFVEISVVPFWTKTDEERSRFVKTIRDLGIRHFIFGSDWPVLHPAEMMKAFRKLPLSDVERDRILYGNSEKLNDLF